MIVILVGMQLAQKRCSFHLITGTFVWILPVTDTWGGQLKGSVKEPNILICFFFSAITQSCSVSDVLFTGGRGVSDFSVLKYY